MLIRALGLKAYDDAWALQKELVEKRRAGEIPDTLLLLEHEPVYTCGISSKSQVPGRLPHPFRLIERGGDVTYHGPGQLVGYPILDLEARGLKVRDYLRGLEGALIEALRAFDLDAYFLRGFTGVWCRDKKIASIGVAVKGGVSYHGFALNVDMDLAPFARINPCNLEAEEMASLSSLLERPVDFGEVRQRVAESFLACFEPAAAPR